MFGLVEVGFHEEVVIVFVIPEWVVLVEVAKPDCMLVVLIAIRLST